MGVTCACIEERSKTSDLHKQPLKKKQQEDASMYGSIGKYQINKQTGKWQSLDAGLFFGHLTEGKVQIDREETFV